MRNSGRFGPIIVAMAVVAGLGSVATADDGPPPFVVDPADAVEQPIDMEVFDGALYVTDQGSDRIHVIGPTGTVKSSWGGEGDADGQFRQPWGIAISDGEVYVTDAETNRIQVFALDGTFDRSWIIDTSPSRPPLRGIVRGIDISPDGRVHVVIKRGRMFHIQIYDRVGTRLDVWEPDIRGNGSDIAIDSTGRIYVNVPDHAVYIFDPKGNVLGTVDAEFDMSYTEVEEIANGLHGLAVDASDHLYVADRPDQRSRVQVFDPDGRLLRTVRGADRNFFYQSVAVGSDGRVFLSYLGDGSGQIESFPPTIASGAAAVTIAVNARPDSPVNFRYGGSLGVFRLDDPSVDDGDEFARSQRFEVDAGVVRIRQQRFSNWELAGVDCTGTRSAQLVGDVLTLKVAAGDDVSCTFLNDRLGAVAVRTFDGVFGRGAVPIGGQLVELYSSDGGLVGTATTASSGRVGSAMFSGVVAGAHAICIRLDDTRVATHPTTIDERFGLSCHAVKIAPATTVWRRFASAEGERSQPSLL